jgi:hypothetical protein
MFSSLGEPSPGQTTASGDGLERGVAGETAEFVIQAKVRERERRGGEGREGKLKEEKDMVGKKARCTVARR